MLVSTYHRLAGVIFSSSATLIAVLSAHIIPAGAVGPGCAGKMSGAVTGSFTCESAACNRAAAQAENAEALSGLARALIYAQARALLVSHWAVDSNATFKLITSALREIGRDKTIGRAEALRRAMLTLINSGDPREAHPAYWAPFVVVGEGTR